MTGIILMVSGIIMFGAGFAIYRLQEARSEELPNNVPVIAELTEKQENRPEGSSGDVSKLADNPEAGQGSAPQAAPESLEKVIKMAIADGVLTNNERNLIRELVEESGHDFDTVISGIEAIMAEMAIDSETQLIDFNKKSGDDFEKFVVQKFSHNYFRLKEWAGDKYINGIYAETTLQPDLVMEFSLKGEISQFAVECKYRSDFHKGGIEFATMEQCHRYSDFAENRNIPVFIAIGVGGKPDNPQYFYVVPLSELDSNFIDGRTLEKYGKNSKSNFFFDPKTETLS